MKKLILFFLIAILFGACTSISFAPKKSGEAKAEVIATPDQVEVYRTEKPKLPYEEIGAVHYPLNYKLDVILQKMKIEASARGGNAIIDIQINAVGALGTVVRIKK